MSAANLISRIEGARSGHQRAKDLFADARAKNSLEEVSSSANSEGGISLSDIGHAALDVAGFIPVVGALADLANAGWYAAEGDYTNAAFSAASAVPGVGDAAAAAKIGVKVVAATGATAGMAAFGKVPRLIRPGSVEDLTRGAKKLSESNQSVIYERSGGFAQANREFDQFTFGDDFTVKDYGNGIRSARLPDGRTASVRPHSSGNTPTIQISPVRGSEGKQTKIRYPEPQ